MAALFKDEEVRDMMGLEMGEDFVEVTCGCTSRRYGDAVGKLKIFATGELEIKCDCYPGCPEDKLIPSAFEKHSVKDAAPRWKYNIWVTIDGKKVPLIRTSLLKYHDRASKPSGSHKGRRQGARSFHNRDEFIQCSKCKKERRFRLQTEEECRVYHDALADHDWKCTDMPFDEIDCNDEEERASRKPLRGCQRSALCKGCTSCVCFGCNLCRFSDCTCRTCVDFVNNTDI